QQHTEQPEIINEGRIDQYPKQCQVKSHMLDSSPDNQTTDYSKQSLKIQTTADDSKPKPRSNNQTSRSLPVSKSSRVTITTVPKANHSKSSSSFLCSNNLCCSTVHKVSLKQIHEMLDNKTPGEVKFTVLRIPIPQTKNSNKPVDQKNHTQKPGTIFTGHRKVIRTLAQARLTVNPTRISNVDILNIHECKQTLAPRTTMSIEVHQAAETVTTSNELDLLFGPLFDEYFNGENQVVLKSSAVTTTDASNKLSTEVHQAAETVTTSNELDLLFGPLFDEYFNGENQVVLKSSAVTTTDASNKRQQQPDSTSSTSTLATTVTANGNFDL
ncbi:hypothetical protein Tco_1199159, partial [Tanacetum coccineum]